MKSAEDCSKLQSDLQTVFTWVDTVNMTFNSDKFEWIRYCVGSSVPAFQYLSPNLSQIERKDNLRDLGVRLSSDLSFSLQIEKSVTTASQRRRRGSHLLLTILKSLVQPHLDYCCQLWCPSTQEDINKIERVQKSLISRVRGWQREKDFKAKQESLSIS